MDRITARILDIQDEAECDYDIAEISFHSDMRVKYQINDNDVAEVLFLIDEERSEAAEDGESSLTRCEVNELADHIKRRIVYLLGGKDSVASKNQVVLKKSLVAIYNQIRVEFGLFDEYGKIKDILKMERKYLADVHEYIDMYELPGFLKDEVEKEKKMAKDKQLQGFMNKQKKLISESDGAERAELIGLAVGFLNGMRISKAITKEEYEKEYEELQKEIRKVG